MADLSKTSGTSEQPYIAAITHTQTLMRQGSTKLIMPILLVVVVCLFSSAAFGQPWDGNGVEGDPYLIYTPADMQAIGADPNYWDKHFKLMADIDLSAYTGTSFNMIGTGGSPFTGVFDGNGHCIANFSYTSTGKNYIGIFGWLAGEGQIKNLGVVDCNINAGDGDYAGGLLARNYYDGHVYNCFATGSVSGDKYVGGLVGKNTERISNCYSMAEVSGTQYVGGLVGYSSGLIMRCYSTGQVSGNLSVGGLIGKNSNVVYNSFWDILTSEQSISDGGSGRTTVQLKSSLTYLGWGTEGVWRLDEGQDYPRLIWEGKPGQDLVAPGPNELYGGGSGTEDAPYLIYTAGQLYNIGLFWKDWEKHFKLMVDVDLSGMGTDGYNAIGAHYDLPFNGTFDGNGYSVKGFSCTANKRYLGLFGVTNSDDAIIKNLTLTSPAVISQEAESVGSLVGYLIKGTVLNCHVKNGVISAQTSAGGLVGQNVYGYISQSSYQGSVSGVRERIGGLVGENQKHISQCSSTGNIYGNKMVGGLVGLSNHGEIVDCYSTANVTLNEQFGAGGLVGYLDDAVVQSCYSTGFVDEGQGSSFGGLIGSRMDSTVENSFWDKQTSHQSNSAGGTGKQTSLMQTRSTFTDAGWDFIGETANGPNDVWDICEGTNYPKLVWQIPVLGDFGCPDGVDINDLNVLVEEWLRQVLSVDVWPDGGDGVVDFLDWAIFADGWQIANDIADLAVFADQWLGRVLSADVAPDRGDDFVDFSDWAAFADAWKSTPESPNWNPECDIAPAGGDDMVDMDDIVVFMAEWLKAASHYRHLAADIAPDGGDGIVNLLDYSVFADSWRYYEGGDFNHEPLLAPIGNKSVNANQALTFEVSATDPDGDTLTCSASNLPDGAAFHSQTRVFNWTPTQDQAGQQYFVTFTVSDGSETDRETITITVNLVSNDLVGHWKMNDNAANRTVKDSSNSGNTGTASHYTFALSVAGKTNNAFAFTASNNTHVKINYTFDTFDSHFLGNERCNQGVARDIEGNFYTFSHGIPVADPCWVDVITKYDSNWNYIKEYKSTNGKVAGDDNVWIFGDGEVIDGNLYIAMRPRNYDSNSAIGVWDLDLNYLRLHEVYGGCAEGVQKYNYGGTDYYWVIQGQHGKDVYDEKGTISRYDTSWANRVKYNLTVGYDGFAWVDDKICCNKNLRMFDIYSYDGSSFSIYRRTTSFGQEGFYTDGTTYYFAGDDDETVYETTLNKRGENLHIGTNDWSISVWVKSSTEDTYKFVVSKDKEGGYDFYFGSDNRFYFIVYDNNGNQKKVRSPIQQTLNLLEGEWHNIVGVFDYDNDIYLYIDNVKYTSYANDAFDAPVSNTNMVYIGITHDGHSGAFDGVIDNVMIFSKALSEGEIEALYNDGEGTETIPTP